MYTWTLADLVHVTRGRLLSGQASARVSSVSTDTRTLQPGDLFIALRGEQMDGHQFVSTALQRGAAAVLVSDAQALPAVSRLPAATPPGVILVHDTLQAFQALALARRQRFPGTVVAITGSNGKTTVKEMSAAVLQQRLRTYKAPGNLNNHIGVPLALLQLDDSHEVAVLEMGMNHLGEIRQLCAMALPHIGVITNIGLAHVGYLGSIAAIQQAKGELIEALDTSSTAIVNADDPRALALGQRAAGRVLTFGLGTGADVRGRIEADRGLEGVLGTLCLEHREYPLHLPVPGAHQMLNALAAAAVGVALGLSAADILAGVQSYHGTYGRLAVKRGQAGVRLIDDTYNASPQSMQAALHCLARTRVQGQRLAILGDMLELGESGPALHADIGALVARSGVQQLITYGPLAQHIAQGAQDAGMDAERIHRTSRQEEVLTVLAPLLRSGDIVLVKGSRGMAMERLVQALVAREGGE
ncbi:MAG: UDP-N-acetylmuramoyl-tripeptide--D-alanyl-D-alanine ligase [Candidatus Tectimicrobiota bacterium]